MVGKASDADIGSCRFTETAHCNGGVIAQPVRGVNARSAVAAARLIQGCCDGLPHLSCAWPGRSLPCASMEANTAIQQRQNSTMTLQPVNA